MVQGLSYIHKSFLTCHGRLSSTCCMVSDSWQVKIADHAFHDFQIEKIGAKEAKKREMKSIELSSQEHFLVAKTVFQKYETFEKNKELTIS